jgi:hypothetical protein
MENNQNMDEYEFDEDESTNPPSTSKAANKESNENEPEDLRDDQKPLKRKSNDTDNENEEDDTYAIQSLNVRPFFFKYLIVKQNIPLFDFQGLHSNSLELLPQRDIGRRRTSK